MSTSIESNPAQLDSDDIAIVAKARSTRTAYHTNPECANVRNMDRVRKKEWAIVRRMGLKWCDRCQYLEAHDE